MFLNDTERQVVTVNADRIPLIHDTLENGEIFKKKNPKKHKKTQTKNSNLKKKKTIIFRSFSFPVTLVKVFAIWGFEFAFKAWRYIYLLKFYIP